MPDFHHLSQRPEVHHVFAQVVSFRRFEHFRDFAKTAITHDEAERVQTNAPSADVFVPVYSRTARSFGVIKMNGNETILADHPIEFTESHSHRRVAPDVVTSRENVRCVEANTQSLRLAHAADDVREMLKFTSQA